MKKIILSQNDMICEVDVISYIIDTFNNGDETKDYILAFINDYGIQTLHTNFNDICEWCWCSANVWEFNIIKYDDISNNPIIQFNKNKTDIYLFEDEIEFHEWAIKILKERKKENA